MKTKAKKEIVRKEIQSLYELAELFKEKKQKEIYYAINHLNSLLLKKD